jgi:hypothetical protein
MGTYPSRFRIPKDLATEIGRIVTRFAFLEHYLMKIVYGVAEVEPKIGRIAIKLGRIEDRIKAIQEIMAIRKFATDFDFADYIKGCKQLETMRDRVSHNIWVKHTASKRLVLQATKGKIPLEKGAKAVDAKLHPVGIDISVPVLKRYVGATKHALTLAKTLGQEVDHHRRAWRRTQIAQLRQGRSRQNPRP